MVVEGLYFYFFNWVSWIIVMFFFPKTSQRTFLSLLLLLAIAGSNSYLTIGHYSVNIAFLLLAFFTFILLIQTLKKHYLLIYFSICTVSLAYVCFQLFEIYDPVWILIDRKWMLSFILLYLGLLLFKGKDERYIYLLAGMLQGEMISSFVFQEVFAYSVVGGFDFLDIAFIVIAGLSVWMMFEAITIYFDTLIQKRVKEKQG